MCIFPKVGGKKVCQDSKTSNNQEHQGKQKNYYILKIIIGNKDHNHQARLNTLNLSMGSVPDTICFSSCD